jgi:long-chain acyl-CoA synthetase
LQWSEKKLYFLANLFVQTKDSFMEKELKKLTLYHFLHYILSKYPQNPALGLVGQTAISFEELGQRIQQVQIHLEKNGIQRKQKVVLLGENTPNWGVAFFATTAMGAVVVPVLAEFPESDMNHIINHSEAEAVFIDEKFYQSLDLSALENIKLIISLDSMRVLKGKESGKDLKTSIPERGKEIEENDLAEILYTSGTTGHSKGVILTHKNIVLNSQGGPNTMGRIDQNTVVLNLLPLAHAYGSTTSFLGALSRGASVYFIDRKPSPKVLLDAMQKLRPTVVTGVPLIFEKIFHKRVLPELAGRRTLQFLVKFNFGRKLLYKKIGQKILESFGGRLDSFVIGGASLNHEVELFLREGKIPYAIGYGLSECSPLVSGDYYKNLKFGSVGRAIDQVKIKIDNPDPQTGVGEILVKGPNVMLGYYKNPEETKKVFTGDGWLRSGDLGFLDRAGYLFIKGRIKNVYVGSSGENIYPEIIEDKLRESMFVEESLVYFEDELLIGRIYPDYDYIQTVLNAQKHTIQPAEVEEILENVRRQTNLKLPAFSQIKKIIAQPEPFIKTPTNKIKRALYIPDYLQR